MYKLIEQQGGEVAANNKLIDKLIALCDSKEEMAQLVLHEVLHVVWAVDTWDGMIRRDQLTQEINRRFKMSSRDGEL